MVTQTWLLPATYELARSEAEESGQTIGAWLAEAVVRRLELDAKLAALRRREGEEFRPLDWADEALL
jgi:hypothetical protein